MGVTFCGQHHSVRFGVQEPKPLKNFPPGKVRLRMRNNDFVHAYVKTSSSIRHFLVDEIDGFWVPILEQGANKRITPI